jgi:hypothetical protein
MDMAKLKVTQVLDGCQRTVVCLENVPHEDKQRFRNYWTAGIRGLRSVEDVLLSDDAQRYPQLKALWEKRRAELEELKQQYDAQTSYDECDSDDYLVYHRLVRGEENSGSAEEVPEYVEELWVSDGHNPPVNWENTYLPMADSDKWGMDDCRDRRRRGIKWGRKEIDALVGGRKQSSKSKRK